MEEDINQMIKEALKAGEHLGGIFTTNHSLGFAEKYSKGQKSKLAGEAVIIEYGLHAGKEFVIEDFILNIYENYQTNPLFNPDQYYGKINGLGEAIKTSDIDFRSAYLKKFIRDNNIKSIQEGKPHHAYVPIPDRIASAIPVSSRGLCQHKTLSLHFRVFRVNLWKGDDLVDGLDSFSKIYKQKAGVMKEVGFNFTEHLKLLDIYLEYYA